MSLTQLRDLQRDLQPHIKDIKSPSSKSYIAEIENQDRAIEASSSSLTIEALMSEFDTKSLSQHDNDPWILDSGASSHMSNDRERFLEISSQP